MTSLPAWLPSCPGTAPRWTPPRRLKWRCVGPNYTAIAGHAIAAGAVLVTNNVREFERVPGLVLEDWVK